MGLTQSMMTGGDAGSTGQPQKCKYDARLAGGTQPCSSKQSSMSKTDDMNPIIIMTTLNSTLNHMVDVMERTLDATAAPSGPTPSTAPPPIILSTFVGTHVFCRNPQSGDQDHIRH